jgi:hypothetical protein|tara:strand:+ start:651 stop:941 length:291 start_codon:yes stop_codon:yes gene_type:complete
MNKKEIVDGYKGIMELDLTDIPENFKKIIVEQHEKDIDNYKAEQYKLKPNLRYENTVERIQKREEYEKKIQKQQIYIQLQEQIKRNEMYNDLHKKK